MYRDRALQFCPRHLCRESATGAAQRGVQSIGSVGRAQDEQRLRLHSDAVHFREQEGQEAALARRAAAAGIISGCPQAVNLIQEEDSRGTGPRIRKGGGQGRLRVTGLRG